MLGPYTPTLLALLTRSGMIEVSTSGLQSFKGKVGCITGAASGIGESLALRAAREGCRALVLADVAWPASRSALLDAHPFIQDVEAQGCEVLPLHVDVGRQSEIERMRDACIENFGAVHLLFSNAGVGMPGVLSATDEALQRALDINFGSVLWGMRTFVPVMEESGEPCRIINTASLAGISEATGLYGVTKHAVVAATEAVASELAWRRSNVEVSVLCPSYVRTNVVRSTAAAQLESEAPPAGRSSDEIARIKAELEGLPKLIAGGMPPDEVASLVFDGLREGKRYIYTNTAHTEASIDDRVEQLRAGGPAKGFRRRMEGIVEDELAR